MRFARAKGSKASNERVPEEATPWSEMKQQLLQSHKEKEDSVKRQEAEQERRKNYQNFLNTLEEEQARNVTWAEFPDNGVTSGLAGKGKKRKLTGVNDNEVAIKKKSKNKCSTNTVEKNQAKNAATEEGRTKEAECEQLNTEAAVGKQKKKKKNKKNNSDVELLEHQKVDSTEKKKKKKIANTELLDEHVREDDSTKKIAKKKIPNVKIFSENGDAGNGKKLKSNKKLKHTIETTVDDSGLANDTTKNIKKNKKKKLNGEAIVSISNDKTSVLKKPPELLTSEEKLKIEKKKQKKVRQVEKRKQFKPEKPYHRRKEPQTSMIYNGKEIPIAYVDGFPIKKEDADRIRKLRQEMIGKGLPRSEIKVSLKLERRKAEKAFAREKKKVCFNCRKAGHNLSECTELNNELISTSGSGICFKCGSTEHTHFQCRVVKGQEFKFAKCFICQEQGHISRQCPDNAKGLYPKGGACRVCGDVTHLKKDCPKFQAQQEKLASQFKGEVMNANVNPDDNENTYVNNNEPKRVNKIIKF